MNSHYGSHDTGSPISPRYRTPNAIGDDPGDRYTRLVKRARSRTGSVSSIVAASPDHMRRTGEVIGHGSYNDDKSLPVVHEGETRADHQTALDSGGPYRPLVDQSLCSSNLSSQTPHSSQPVFRSVLTFDASRRRESAVSSEISEPLPTYTGFARRGAPATDPIRQHAQFDDLAHPHFTNPFAQVDSSQDHNSGLRRRAPAPGPDLSYYHTPPIPNESTFGFGSLYDAYGNLGRTSAIQPSPHYREWDDDEYEKHRLAHYHTQADWDPDDEYYDPEPSVLSRGLYSDTSLSGYYEPHVFQDDEQSGEAVGHTLSGATIIVGSEKGRKQFITENICPLEQRRSFIIVLSKALLQYQAPSHRIENQLSAAAHVLEVPADFLHLPSLVIVSFGSVDGEKGAPMSKKSRKMSLDSKRIKSAIVQAVLGKSSGNQDLDDQPEPDDKPAESGGSGTTFGVSVHIVKSGGRLELGKLHELHQIYRKVVHDEMSAQDGRIKLLKLLKEPPCYTLSLWERCTHAFFCGLLICVMSFGGSFLDMWVAGAGCATIAFLQLHTASKNPIYSNIFEISAAMLVSFVARGLSSIGDNLFCYSAISSAGVAAVLILPGSIVLASSLELASRNIVSGSVKIVYAIVYSLFLGFSLTIGSDLYLLVDKSARPHMKAAASNISSAYDLPGTFTDDSGQVVFSGAFTFLKPAASVSNTVKYVSKGCVRNLDSPWYLQQLPMWTLFVLVPIYSIISSLWKLQPFRNKQLPIMVFISCASYAANKAANMFIFNRSDVVSAIGAFVTGLLGNAYARIFRGTAFTIMVTAVSFLVPSGIAAAGGLAQTYENSEGDQYSTGLALGFRMVQVAIGCTVGLFGAGVVVYSFGSKKRSGYFAF
ncbi:pheromone-regulated membrane protein [Ceratobasidium sp. AG-Ba]|nr:pheromone-regulated membrane protein [Ceratobasidium sp. AG-Ba]